MVYISVLKAFLCYTFISHPSPDSEPALKQLKYSRKQRLLWLKLRKDGRRDGRRDRRREERGPFDEAKAARGLIAALRARGYSAAAGQGRAGSDSRVPGGGEGLVRPPGLSCRRSGDPQPLGSRLCGAGGCRHLLRAPPHKTGSPAGLTVPVYPRGSSPDSRSSAGDAGDAGGRRCHHLAETCPCC